MTHWTNPTYAPAITDYETHSGHTFHPVTLGNCTNCQGSGRHIYVDTDGTLKDLPCQACSGSGQTQ